MAEDSGVSANYVDSAIASLREDLMGEIHSLAREMEREINRLEAEMREVGQMIASEIRDQTSRLVGQIETQTVAVVGGVAANTVMLERTRNQIEEDFSKTRTKLDLQTEATLQVEVGKKIADTLATQGKLAAFAKDIKSRFEKSLETLMLNRQLYNVNFRKIFDEYSNKLKVIGQHIFVIRESDIAPAIKAAQAPLEEIHGLPMEVDLFRLKVRAESLDEALQILRNSRFDKVLNSITSLERTLAEQFGLGRAPAAQGSERLQAVVLATSSAISTDLIVGREARPPRQGQAVNVGAQHPDLAVLESERARELAMQAIALGSPRPPTPEDLKRLVEASRSLAAKKLISEEGVALFEDFLGSGNLRLVG